MAVVFAVAVLARVGWTVLRWSAAGDGPGLLFPDEHDYWAGGVSLAGGDGLVDADGRRATRMPLYPGLLALFTEMPDGAWWARLLQGLLGALTAPLIAALAWRLAGRRAGWLAGVLAAVDPFSVYFSQLLVTETLFTTALAGFWAVAWPIGLPDGRRRSWRWPVAGALFLVMVYLRPATIGLMPIWAVFVAVAARRAGGNFAGLILMGTMLVAGLMPWVWRNNEVLDKPVLLTTRFGISLYDGQGPHADGSSNLGFTRAMDAHMLGECEWNQWFRNEAFKAMRADPARVWRLAWVKAGRMWDPLPHAPRAQSRVIKAISAGWSLAVFALAIPGLWHWRRRIGASLLLLLPAIHLTALHMIFVGSIRYRLPVMPLIEVLSAVGLCWLLGLIRPRWRPTAPPSEPQVGDHRPRSWLERLFDAARYGRRPVSLWRRRLAMAGLLALALGYYGYQYFTSDERIRQQAVEFLERFTGGEVRIRQARFALFSGISLRDVMIAMPRHINFDPTAETFEQRQVFAAVTLQLQHEPFGLLTGRLRVPEIVADQPTVTLVKNAEHGRYTYNWQALFPPQPVRLRRRRGGRPVVRIRNARVRIVEIISGERQIEPDIDLSALALPDPHRFETYTIPWRKSGEQPERGKLFYNLKVGTYSGQLPTLPVTTVKATLPPRYTEWLETLEIAGQIKAEHVHYDSRRGSRAAIRLEGIRFSVPMHEDERPAAEAPKRFLQLSDVTGQIVLTPTQSTARLRCRLNDANARVTATVTNYAGPFEEVGFDIHLSAKNVLLPDPNDPAGARFIQRIAKVRSFFNDFDPHGHADIDFHLVKAPGRDMGVLVRGTFTPRGCDASYRMFPYRLTNVTGTTRFTNEGIRLENLAGDHGSGFVVINGHLDGPNWYTGLRLHVVGDNVPLDPALFNAVPEKFRDVWRRFDTVGLANVNVQLRRESGTAEKGPGQWTTRIQAELVEAFARFIDFPYGLRHVTGKLTIENDRIVMDGLRGTHGSASVQLGGVARYGARTDRELELRLEAKDLALDDDLAAALAGEGRDAFRRVQPSGRTDLLGRVSLPRGSERVRYDLVARLREAAIRYESLPVRIDRIQGTLAITPGKIELLNLAGRRGPTHVTVDGYVERRQDGNLVDLTVGCDRLRLDEDLRQALPDELKKIWQMLTPTGTIRLRTRIRRAGSGARAVSSHDTTVDALGNSICYEGLPLPLSDVHGQIHITDEQVALRTVAGRHGAGRIELSGRIPLTGQERVGRLRLRVEAMPFDEPLRRALPWRIRKAWSDIQPTGTFNLDLDELTYRVVPDRPSEWTYRGRIDVQNASLNVGFKATDVTGSLIGVGTANSDGSGMTIDADVELKRAAVNQRVLTDVTGGMRRVRGSDVLVLDDLLGRTYGGRASGFGRVTFGRADTRYALYIIVRDMVLGPFLNSTRPRDASPTKAKGTVDARLYLSGVSGRVPSRQGTGEVHVRKAQMYKLPFVLAMLTAINITIPDDNAFNDARTRFHLQGNRLVFDDIELSGKSLSMLGAGSMDTENEHLDLTFITGSPHRLPRIPLLIDMVRGVSRELMEIKITGPLSNPNMQGRPLRSLRATLEALFGPKQLRDGTR